jgi:hypothetical protein
VIARLAISDGIDTKNLIFTEQQIAAADQQAMRQQLLQSVAPNAVNAAGGWAKENTKGQYDQMAAENQPTGGK